MISYFLRSPRRTEHLPIFRVVRHTVICHDSTGVYTIITSQVRMKSKGAQPSGSLLYRQDRYVNIILLLKFSVPRYLRLVIPFLVRLRLVLGILHQFLRVISDMLNHGGVSRLFITSFQAGHTRVEARRWGQCHLCTLAYIPPGRLIKKNGQVVHNAVRSWSYKVETHRHTGADALRQ